MAPKRVSLKGKGASIFFGDDTETSGDVSSNGVTADLPRPSLEASVIEEAPSTALEDPPPATTKPITSRKRSSEHASKHASTLANSDYVEFVSEIRRAVKVPGKEVTYVRLTPQEKQQLADVVYTYKRQGRRTSENEIGRIAINFLMADYRANGGNSMLAKVLEALQA